MGGAGGRLDQMQVRWRTGHTTHPAHIRCWSNPRFDNQLSETVPCYPSGLVGCDGCVYRLEWPKEHYFPPCALSFRDGWEPPSSREQRQEELRTRLAQEVGRQWRSGVSRGCLRNC